MITTTIIVFFILSFIFGGIIAWFLASARCQRKNAELEKRASGVEAVNNELRQEIQQRDSDLKQIRAELDVERQIKSDTLARLDESQKSLQKQKELLEAMETRLSDKFSSLSLNALSKNSAEFLKLAEETLRSQTIEGKKELESKKELIDQNIEAIGKTLSEVQRRIEEVGKISGEKFTEVATLIKKHEEVTSKLKDTTESLAMLLQAPRKEVNGVSGWQKILSDSSGW